MGRKLTVKGRILKLEHLQRDLILKENKKCAYCHQKATMVDHLFSRRHRALFFYRDNLNPICAGCNQRKGFGQGDIAATLFFDTRQRIGEDRWKQMVDLLNKPFPNFQKTWYLDMIEEQLKDTLLDKLKKKF